ncbi:hypothetical protein SAMN02745248_01746 [Hathewaya proteolytica DSM 3090]|uniref:Uncharacterized protein n=1 Tax=Hathewaya proteolytica DSM 3090 TaxID=1121331 RepID=A0A1M6PL17_9CLOT|nr:hypothetical protein [Hathewaya proteolytica]SHK08676.1 hypothetical protein SAMN02745248_01746 [Hathewaya proteolytica DSM 3090]
MKQRVVTVDLKNRKHHESLILDIGELEGNGVVSLKLDFNNSINTINKYINEGKIEESEKAIERYKDSFAACSDKEVHHQFVQLKNISNSIYNIEKNLDTYNIEAYRVIRQSHKFLVEYMREHDISAYTVEYLTSVQKSEKYMDDFDFKMVLEKLMCNINMESQYAYLYDVVDFIKKGNIHFSMEPQALEVFQRLSNIVEQYNGELIKKYNNNSARISLVKKLVTYGCGKLIEEGTFKIYIKSLKDHYNEEDMDQLRRDFEELFVLYKMNSADSFEEFYYNLYIMAEKYAPDFMALNEYYKKYVAKNMYKNGKKSYDKNSFCKIVSQNVESVEFNTDFTVLYL